MLLSCIYMPEIQPEQVRGATVVYCIVYACTGDAAADCTIRFQYYAFQTRFIVNVRPLQINVARSRDHRRGDFGPTSQSNSDCSVTQAKKPLCTAGRPEVVATQSGREPIDRSVLSHKSQCRTRTTGFANLCPVPVPRLPDDESTPKLTTMGPSS